MYKKYVIGLDIGTTSAKAVVFHKEGQVIAEHESPYPTIHPSPNLVEQDPYVIEQAAIYAIRHAMEKSRIESKELISVGISTAMHALICVDKNGEALTNSITWADRRSVQQAESLKNSSLGIKIYLQTGTPIHPMSPLNKLTWMRETKQPVLKKTWKFFSIKEFITYRWFKKSKVDYAIAAASGMFNIHTFDWDEDALEVAGIKKDQLSDPVPPTFVLKNLDPKIASEMNLPVGLPFVIGASDGPLANLGIGAIEPGDTAITIGTSGAIRQMASHPKTDSNQEVFCYSVTDDLWVLGGPTNNGGNVFQWIKNVFEEKDVEQAERREKDVFAHLTEVASKVPAGAEGLLFLPFLYGERAPHWDGKAKGAYIGLSAEHQKGHLIRAGLEGVVFNLYQISKVLNRLTGPTNRLYASGGFARSSLWVQILADVFGQEVHIPESHQSSAWGAAWLSLLAVGEVDSLADIKRFVPMKSVISPHSVDHGTYQQVYQVYHGLYGALVSSFHQLDSLKK